jgi:hypothetical protein
VNENGGLQAAQIDSAGNVVEAAHTVFATNFGISAMAGSGARIVGVYNGDRLAIFDADGRLLESGIALPSPPGSTVSLTSNGHGFLVTFSTFSTLYAMPLDAFGHPAGPVQVIAQGVPFQAPASASNGNEYLVVVRTATGASSLRISSSGTFIDRHDLPASVAQHSLTWTGSEYVYTWSNDVAGTISALRLDPSGAASSGGPVVLANSAGGQTIMTVGSRLLLVWMVWTSPLYILRAETVSPVTLAHTAPAVVSSSAAEQREPRIVWSGQNYLMIWLEGTTLYAARLDADGRSRDPHGIVVASFARNANVVFDGENFVVAWQQTTNNNLWLNRIDAGGALLDGDGVPVINFACTYDIAAGRFATMIAFGDCGGHLQAMRFNRALQPLDVPLTITPSDMKATTPSIAWSGTQWLVAFEESIALPVFFEVPPDFTSRGNIRAVRISPSMTLVDTAPLLIATSDADLIPHRSPHAASGGGDDFLIAWTRGFLSGTREVYARKLGASSPTYIAAGMAQSAIRTGIDYAIGFISPNSDALGVTFRDAPQSFFKVAVTVDAEPSLALVAANGRLSGAYARVATEPLYGGVSRVFIRDARPLHGRAAAH